MPGGFARRQGSVGVLARKTLQIQELLALILKGLEAILVLILLNTPIRCRR
ncbi:hypothetical protein BLL52_2234 [Rhodoferax antarcticus ANT.BR]|uniref:Uncharacterized protein n=1 Tax=Rhodoferax antarcticus ANT.BR TaxID=1111071 RepID=A0A1Q8YD83_9BURK|nr:hypothetical protein BLL52_2234 [Rhodoferax antarcticus ANT.BR]